MRLTVSLRWRLMSRMELMRLRLGMRLRLAVRLRLGLCLRWPRLCMLLLVMMQGSLLLLLLLLLKHLAWSHLMRELWMHRLLRRHLVMLRPSRGLVALLEHLLRLLLWVMHLMGNAVRRLLLLHHTNRRQLLNLRRWSHCGVALLTVIRRHVVRRNRSMVRRLARWAVVTLLVREHGRLARVRVLRHWRAWMLLLLEVDLRVLLLSRGVGLEAHRRLRRNMSVLRMMESGVVLLLLRRRSRMLRRGHERRPLRSVHVEERILLLVSLIEVLRLGAPSARRSLHCLMSGLRRKLLVLVLMLVHHHLLVLLLHQVVLLLLQLDGLSLWRLGMGVRLRRLGLPRGVQVARLRVELVDGRAPARGSALLLDEACLGQQLLHHLVLGAVMADERHEVLAYEGALLALEGRLLGDAVRDLAVEVLRAVVVVERAPVHQHLAADLAVVGFDVAEAPLVAQLLLHELEDDLVRQPVVPADVHDVAAGEGAHGAGEGSLVGHLLQDLLPEVAEQVDALVPGLVHAGGELLAAQLAARLVALHVHVLVDGQLGQVEDFLEGRLLAVGGHGSAALDVAQLLIARRDRELGESHLEAQKWFQFQTGIINCGIEETRVITDFRSGIDIVMYCSEYKFLSCL